MQKTRKSICRWAKVALLCAAVFCVGSGIKLLDANNVSAEEGTEVAYKLDYATPTFVTTKTDNVYYDVDFTFENLAYLRNDTATDGNITISYDTISESHDYSSMNGLVRAGATIDAKYAYSGAYWEIFGNHIAGSGNKSFYEAGKTTVISYDVATHKFTTTIGGEAITLNAYAANAKTAEAIDTEGGKYIAVGVANSNDNYQSAKVTNLKVTDANGWDLGYKLSGNEPTALTSQRMATAGKTISFKMGELPEDFEEVAIYGADGRILDVELTENEGVYSFTMPSENVTIGYVSSFQPFAIEYEGFTAKLDNVYYNMEIEATKPSYVYNTNATAGNISVSYKTISESHDFGTNMNGVVRSAKFTDIAYAFNNSYWQVFGNHIAGSSNKSFYEADKVTTITYDVTTHTFSVVIDGVERVSEMSGYAGNTVKDPADIDALEGGKYIAIGSSNSGYQSMKVTDLRIADADGWDLGVSYSVGGNYQPIKDLSKWALSNKTITLKVDGEKDFDKLAIADVDGNILDVAVNEVEEGVYAFTMPEQAVKVVKINEVNAVDYYGNYFNAADNTMLIVAEENSGIKTGDDFVAYTFKFYSDDTLAAIPEEGATLKGKVGTNVITLNDKDYIKLADYTVTFDLNGAVGSIDDVTLTNGNYTVTKPTDPTREGYKFVGWALADGSIFDFSKIVTDNLTLKAVWEFVEPADEGYVAYGISYEGFTAKLDNVFYNMEIEATKPSYVYNTTAIEGNISASWLTLTESHDIRNLAGDGALGMNGIARNDKFTDIAYAYLNGYWEIYGNHIASSNNKSFYEAGKITSIYYDVTTHKFTTTIDGVTQKLNAYAGNAATAEAVDQREGGKYIAIGTSNVGYQSMKVTYLRIMDDNGWDLGVSYSVGGNYQPIKDLSKAAYAGKTITLKLNEGIDATGIMITDENGNVLDIEVTENNGLYTFVMPEQAITVSAIELVETSKYYGTYYNADSDNLLIVSEDKCGMETADGFVAYTVNFYTNKTVELIPAEGDKIVGSIKGVKITLGDAVYSKLGTYTVSFNLDGGTGEADSVEISTGDYKVAKPADPTKEGYIFKGWATSDGTLFDFNKRITGSMELTAIWEAEGGVTPPTSEEPGESDVPPATSEGDGESDVPPATSVDDKDDEDDGGCFGNVTSTVATVAMLMLAMMALVILRKKA